MMEYNDTDMTAIIRGALPFRLGEDYKIINVPANSPAVEEYGFESYPQRTFIVQSRKYGIRHVCIRHMRTMPLSFEQHDLIAEFFTKDEIELYKKEGLKPRKPRPCCNHKMP